MARRIFNTHDSITTPAAAPAPQAREEANKWSDCEPKPEPQAEGTHPDLCDKCGFALQIGHTCAAPAETLAEKLAEQESTLSDAQKERARSTFKTVLERAKTRAAPAETAGPNRIEVCAEQAGHYVTTTGPMIKTGETAGEMTAEQWFKENYRNVDPVIFIAQPSGKRLYVWEVLEAFAKQRVEQVERVTNSLIVLLRSKSSDAEWAGLEAVYEAEIKKQSAQASELREMREALGHTLLCMNRSCKYCRDLLARKAGS